MADEDIKETLRLILQMQRDQRQEIDDLSTSLVRLVKELDINDRREEREGEREERAREKLYETIDGLTQRIENVGASLRDLPEKLLAVIEKKIYELRIARWEALQAGAANEAGPLPSYREPTGKFAPGGTGRIQRIEPEDDLSLTPAQQRGIFGIFRAAWRHKWTIGGVTLLEIGHRVYEWVRGFGH